MKQTGKNRRRLGTVLTCATAMIVASAMPAAAHVTVNPKEATAGGYAKLTFRVPNEKPDASTVKLEVALPEEAAFASVSVKPVAGWTVATEKHKLTTPIKNHDTEITEAVSKIVWTADAASAISPGQFQEFDVSVGPVPEVSQVIFKALQTYSNGEVVRWIEEPKAGAELERPAPVLKVLPKTEPVAASVGNVAEAGAGAESSGGGNGWSVGLSIAALLIALAALGLALRRKATPTA
jgi:uncharacterized protein YcnI